MNPYSTLGVDRTATKAEIRAAFRKKAKAAHPDHGGSNEKLHELKSMSLLLLDDKRRDRFDRTGDAGEKEVDNSASLAMVRAQAALDAVFSQLEASGKDANRVDLVEGAVNVLQRGLIDAKRHREKAQKDADRLRRIGQRFKAKEGKTNVLGAIYEARAKDMEYNIEKNLQESEVSKSAILLLQDHEYEWDRPEAPVARTGSFGAFMRQMDEDEMGRRFGG